MQVIKRDQTNSRLKITIPEMNSLRISTSDLSSQSWKSENLKRSHLKIIQSEEHKDKGMNKNEESLWGLWDTIKNRTSNNGSFIRREQRERDVKEFWRNYDQQVILWLNTWIYTFKKLSELWKGKTQEIHPETCSNKTFKGQRQRKNLESSKRELNVLFKEESLRKRLDFLAETMEARRLWDDIFKAPKERKSQ